MSNNDTLPTIVFTPERDKYGRSCHRLSSYPTYRTLGYVVRLPKLAWESCGGNKYLVNDWTANDRNQAVSYHPTLKAAKAALVAQVQA